MPPLNTYDRPTDMQGNTIPTTTERRYFSNESYVQKLLKNLNLLRIDSRFCDVELIAGKSVINAHRVVLSASSPYFEAMFRPELGLCEAKKRTVTLHSISPNILKLLMDFIYTNKVEITQNNVQELLAAADMLQLNEVVEGCCEYLVRELHSSNALGILRFAEAHSCTELAQSAQTFVNTHFPDVAQEAELLDVPPALLIRLIALEDLRVDSELQVFNAALRWVKHDIVNRRRHVFEILYNVRLPLVPMRLIDAAISECHDVSLQVALKSVKKDLTSGRGHLVPVRVNPRICAKKSIYVIGGSRREPSNLQSWKTDHHQDIFESVVKYDIYRKEWTEVAPMQIGRILPGVAALGGKIFVFGGERGSQVLANGEAYDPQTNTWKPLAPMITPRCEFGLATLGGTLFAVGGWVGEDIGYTMECYDPVKDVWSKMGELPEARFSMGVVSFEGLIYIVGGCSTASRHLPDLISYNPVTGEWTKLAMMQTARCQMGVTILDRHLYVVGGNSSHQEVLRTVEKYSFDEDKWYTVAPMSVSRASPAVCSADGLLYVGGGDQVTIISKSAGSKL